MSVRVMIVWQNPNEVAAAQAAQARGAAEQARDAAVQAQQRAADAAQRAEQQGADVERPGAIIVTGDGKTIPLDAVSRETLQELGAHIDGGRDTDPGPYIVGVFTIVALAAVLITGLVLRYRVRMRGLGAPQQLTGEVVDRMARIESAVEAVAVDVERISEGQRFTAKLLADRAPVEVPRG